MKKQYLHLIYIAVIIIILVQTVQAQTETVGTLNGNLSISPGGGAVYTINIDLPPGRGGLTPQLALQYNSQGETGVLGKGWGISGWSFVERTPQTQYYDNQNGGVVFNADDKYALDGQRLILVSEEEIGGKGFFVYRTEIDNVSKILKGPFDKNKKGTESEKNEDFYFTVRSPDGLVKIYGGTLTMESRQVYLSNPQPIRWHLDRVADQMGNRIEYKYERVVTNGEIYLKGIRYSKHSSLANQPHYEIVFNYKPLQDSKYWQNSLFAYAKTLFQYDVRQKLTSIKVYYGNDLLKEYALDYKIAGILNNEYLAKVTLVNNENSSLKPTFFTWEYNSNEDKGDQITIVSDELNYWKPNITSAKGDFNGDGMDDIVEVNWSNYTTKIWLNQGGNGVMSRLIDYYGRTEAADFAGLGKDQLLISQNMGYNKYIRLYEIGTYGSVVSYGGKGLPGVLIATGDFTGDGLADMIVLEGSKHYIYEGNPNLNSFFSESNKKTLNGLDTTTTYLPGSFDGSGRLGLVNLYGTTIYHFVIKEDGDGFKAFKTFDYTMGFMPLGFELGDFNGDGKTDVLTSKWVGTKRQSIILYGYGGGFLEKIEEVDGSFWTKEYIVADFNNDGLSDVFYVNSVTPGNDHITIEYVKLFKHAGIEGAGFVMYQSEYKHDLFGIDCTEHAYNHIAGDFNGNGENQVAFCFTQTCGDPANGIERGNYYSYRSAVYLDDITSPDDRITHITN
ncbi:MAG: SpvB/TcaC N-terminal domain-containing protein, partial [Bacteroidales bacterium]|nr:SpvB/TcaC N-terminal domain-containing protein [Bacteroidales bacterium]